MTYLEAQEELVSLKARNDRAILNALQAISRGRTFGRHVNLQALYEERARIENEMQALDYANDAAFAALYAD